MKFFILLSFLLLFSTVGLFPLGAASLEEGITSPVLKQALKLIQSDRSKEALILLSGMKVNAKEAVYRSYLFGKAFEALHQEQEALVWYRRAYFQAPTDEIKALALLERASAYYRLKNYDEARIIYHLFFEKFPIPHLQGRAHLGMAQCLAREGNGEKALEHYQRAGEGALALLGQAVVLHHLGRFPEAEEYFRKGIALDKDLFFHHQEFLFYYGDTLLELGQRQEALPYLTFKLSDPIYKKKGELSLGRGALKSRNFSEAQRLLESARLSSDLKTREEAQFLLAETLLAMGKKEAAYQTFREYWISYPMGRFYPGTLLQLAGLDLENGRAERAVRFLKELGFLPRLDLLTLNRLERLILQWKEKDPGRIVALWRVVGRHFLEPQHEPLLWTMAGVLKNAGESDLAILHWLARNGSETMRLRSRCLLVRRSIEDGRWREAEEELRILRAGKVPADEIKRLQALLYQAKGEYKHAGQTLLTVKRLEAEDLPLLQDSLLLGGEEDRTLKALERQISRLGGNAQIYNRLGDQYLARGRNKEALRYYQKALEMDPLNEWALFRTGSLTEGEEGQRMLGKLKEETSLIGRMARIQLKEKEIRKRLEEGW